MNKAQREGSYLKRAHEWSCYARCLGTFVGGKSRNSGSRLTLEWRSYKTQAEKLPWMETVVAGC